MGNSCESPTIREIDNFMIGITEGITSISSMKGMNKICDYIIHSKCLGYVEESTFYSTTKNKDEFDEMIFKIPLDKLYIVIMTINKTGIIINIKTINVDTKTLLISKDTKIFAVNGIQKFVYKHMYK